MQKTFEIKLNEAAHVDHVWEGEAEREGFAILDSVLRLFMKYALENTEGATVPDDLDAREALDEFEVTHFDQAVSLLHSAWQHLLAGAHDKVNGVSHAEEVGELQALVDLLGQPGPNAGMN